MIDRLGTSSCAITAARSQAGLSLGPLTSLTPREWKECQEPSPLKLEPLSSFNGKRKSCFSHTTMRFSKLHPSSQLFSCAEFCFQPVLR